MASVVCVELMASLGFPGNHVFSRDVNPNQQNIGTVIEPKESTPHTQYVPTYIKGKFEVQYIATSQLGSVLFLEGTGTRDYNYSETEQA